jgi:hypothetical protein
MCIILLFAIVINVIFFYLRATSFLLIDSRGLANKVSLKYHSNDEDLNIKKADRFLS